MEENVLSREEIATYLKDFAHFMLHCSALKGRITFEEAFTATLLEQGRAQDTHFFYYRNMIDVAQFFIAKKFFSLWYDETKDYLREEDLNGVIIPDSIFIDPKDAKRFSNLQKVNLIRNALNHNDNSSHEKYYLKRENDMVCLYIDLMDTRTEKEKQDPNSKPKPFRVKIHPEELSKIINSLMHVKMPKMSALIVNSYVDQTYEHAREIINSLVYRRFYRKNRLSANDYQELLEELKKVLKEYKENPNKKEAVKQLNDACRKYGFSYIDYPLTIPQKEKIMKNLDYWKSIGMDFPVAFSHEVAANSVFPEQSTISLLNLSGFLASYAIQPDKSTEDYSVENIKKMTDKHRSLSFEERKKVCQCLDHDSLFCNAIALYWGYIFDTMMDSDKVVIGTKEYEKDHIRNSFVHGRHFFDKMNRIHLLDWNYGFHNIMNKESSSYNVYRIPMVDIMISSDKKVEENPPEMNYPLEAYTSEGKMIMFYVRNGKMYYVHQDDEGIHLKERDGTYQEREVEDPNLYQSFLEQIEEAENRIEARYYHEVEKIKKSLEEQLNAKRM